MPGSPCLSKKKGESNVRFVPFFNFYLGGYCVCLSLGAVFWQLGCPRTRLGPYAHVLVVKRRVASASRLDHRALVDSRSVKCNFSLCSTSDTVKSCGVLVNSAGWRLPCTSGPPVDGPKDPWSRSLETSPRWHATIY